MVNLVHLKLHQNRLTGTCCRCLAGLEGSTIAILTCLLLAGNIPTEFGQLINMQYLALDWNLLTGRCICQVSQVSQSQVS